MTSLAPCRTNTKAASNPAPSTSNINTNARHSSSLAASRPHPTIVTSPPWARDEPPSPKQVFTENYTVPPDSDVTSHHSSLDTSNPGSRWWSFTLPRPREQSTLLVQGPLSPTSPKRSQTLRDFSMLWLPSSYNGRRSQEGTGSFGHHRRSEKENERERDPADPSSVTRDWNLTIPMPTPAAPFTLSQCHTPGWDSPWTARVPHFSDFSSVLGNGTAGDQAQHQTHNTNMTRRKNRLRVFILTNTYVPLLFRFINITLTAAALAVAIRIRENEVHYNIRGALGSSTTLVIIFAPLTLVHVMVAIYLDYFGRPLGLWRTSAKLAHTLSEVLFICAWSAALSLCFDNFFTSLVPCAPPSSIAWYSTIPRPPPPILDLGRHEGGVADTICDDQLALICLVGVGLMMYCTNLVISLFRIFEKVKYQH